MAVIEAIADLRGCEATELASLYTVIDPDALDALANRPATAGQRLEISFEYEGVSVEVRRDEELTIVVEER